MERGGKLERRGIFCPTKMILMDANLLNNWGVECDSDGDWVRVKYPFRVRLFLSKSPKMFSLNSGELQED